MTDLRPKILICLFACLFVCLFVCFCLLYEHYLNIRKKDLTCRVCSNPDGYMYFERKCSGSHSDKHELLKFPCRQNEIKLTSIKRCSFVWFFGVQFENFSFFIWRRHNLRRRAANFDISCSALMAVEQ